jgi:hypothetical protein
MPTLPYDAAFGQPPYDEALTGMILTGPDGHRGWDIALRAVRRVTHVHRDTAKVYDGIGGGMAFSDLSESHFSIYDFGRLTLSNACTDMRESGRQSRLWRDLVPILWFRTMQFWGTYQGYRRSGPITQALRQTFYYPPGSNDGGPDPRDVRPILYGDPQE